MQQTKTRAWGPACAAGLVLAILLSTSARAADFETHVPDSLLTAYARSVGAVSGKGTFLYLVRGTNCVICPSYWMKRTWSWTVRNPRFVVRSGSAVLQATIDAQTTDSLPRTSSSTAVELPVTVQRNAEGTAIAFTVSDPALTISLGSWTAGTVQVGRYYSTTVPLSRARFTTAGRTVQAWMQNVGIVLYPGRVVVSGDLSFQ